MIHPTAICMTLNNWFRYIQKYLFHLKDGFFELSYMSNSPQMMLDSISKLPVTNHKSLQQCILLNTPFCNGTMYYREIEKGLWILATHLEIKENIITKAVYDECQSSEFYMLTFSVFEYNYTFKDSEEITLLSTCWTLSKPETEVATYFYKGTKGTFFNVAITKEWAYENLSAKKFSQRRAILNFLNGEKGFYTWLDIAPKAHGLAQKIKRILEEENGDAFELKRKGIKLMKEFFNNSFQDNRILDNISLSNSDYYYVAKAEKMILHHLHVPFLGIESIAAYVNTSPTKLKSDFKTVFGFSMLQYHKEKNMLLAMQLIQNSAIQIQDIATVIGYECASKFAANFKKRFGKLPSEVRFFGDLQKVT
jgi:AraC-like DNA-binding protein